MLTIDRETSTVALRSKEFELAIRGSLCNIGIQIEEGIDIAAVARKLSNSCTANRLTDCLILSVYQRSFDGYIRALLCGRRPEYHTGGSEAPVILVCRLVF